MTVHIGQMQSDVQVEPSGTSPSRPAQPLPARQDVERVRAAQERLARERARTRAEGSDD